MLRIKVLLNLLLFSGSKIIFAQTLSAYPRISGYVGVLHPIVSWSSEGAVYNFKDYYVAGLPTGINIWKNETVGFSAEFVPYIRAERGTSKMNNFLFHPGVLVRLGNGFTFAGRAAFETSGRYGFTPVINYTFIKTKNLGYFIAAPLPLRFGNEHPTSLGLGFQFGVSF